MFHWVNGYYQQIGKPPLFQIELVGIEKKATQTNGIFAIQTQKHIDDIKKTDLIIVPAIHGDFTTNLKNNVELLPWLIKHYKQGAELVSFFLGSFYIDGTGLFVGKPCSTHLGYANELRNRFPKANIRG